MKWIALLVLLVGCGDAVEPPASPEPEPEPEPTGPALAGVWTTTGEDETFGAVGVEMTLEADGRLSMVLVLESGARRTFPGSWEIDADQLVLKGAYFEPEGESRVRWTLEDAVLVLEDAEGRRQEWRRRM